MRWIAMPLQDRGCDVKKPSNINKVRDANLTLLLAGCKVPPTDQNVEGKFLQNQGIPECGTEVDVQVDAY